MENSILFPRVQVSRGAVVRDSILFFNNTLAEGCRFEKVISDVNNTFGRGCRLGGEGPPGDRAITVLGWNNFLPAGTMVGSGCTLYPELKAAAIAAKIAADTVVR